MPGLVREQLSELAAVLAGAQGCQRPNRSGHVHEPVAETILLGPQIEEDSRIDLLERFVKFIEQQDQLVLALLQGGVQPIAETQGHLEDVRWGNQSLVGSLQLMIFGQGRATLL